MLECISQKFKAAEATLEVEQVLTQLPVDIGYSLTTTHNNSQRNVLNSIFRPILRIRKSNFGHPLFWRPLSAEAPSSKAEPLKFFSSSGLVFQSMVQPINFYKHICIFHCTICPSSFFNAMGLEGQSVNSYRICTTMFDSKNVIIILLQNSFLKPTWVVEKKVRP